MSQGDHIFDDIVAKLQKSFASGLAELRSVKAASSASQVWTNLSVPLELWLQQLPGTREALEHLQCHPELVTLRSQLQTGEYLGGDINGIAYSNAATQFERAGLVPLPSAVRRQQILALEKP